MQPNLENPESIYDEAVRLHHIYLALLEAGFKKYVNDNTSRSDVLDLAETIIWSDLDLVVPVEEWLPDLKRTAEWLLRIGRNPCGLPDRENNLLFHAVRKFGARVQSET